MNSRRSLGSVTVALLVVALLLPASRALGEDLFVEYAGELIDEDARPLGGVFALEFALYREQEAEEPIWRERHYVAVIDGQYDLQLGRDEPLDPNLAGSTLWVAVSFLEQEILRDSIEMVPYVEAGTAGETTASGASGAGAGGPAEVTFAHLADRAIFAEEAERAIDCETLAGRTVEEIDRTDELIERLADHQADPNAHGSRGGAGIGSSTIVLQSVGGDGGSRYTRMCPTGYVVVGIRGGAGGFVDSLELVCAPLE